ncbi:MAG: AAA family ATPase [Candidatus Omnitrophica bacterium]|nr:AAA family ATPase [Candidatus Omnitrophota bacterium]
MYLKRLEIFGFKSFADKTVLNFEPGITAVVGPNGCGKSNVFDSIRWVLGEQSAKELRGAAMGDVIFNGTEKKASLGFAEVSLTFSNESKMLPIDYDEVTITRRLFRSGESEYLLNKTPVRLKDIQELLMGTGIGSEAYSLLPQGKVDMVVSAKPEERRMILDEASGITKYKAKKKEALNRLKDTENNLIRVNDITIEVKRQIASIERQAKKASKYKEKFELLKNWETKYSRHQIKELQHEKSSMDIHVKEVTDKINSLNQELEETAEYLTNEINYLGEVEQKINDINSQEIKLDGQIDLNCRQVGFNQERIENLMQNDRKLKEQKGQLIEKCKIQQEKIEELKQELITLEEVKAHNEKLLNEKRDELAVLEHSVKDAKDKIKGNEENILSLSAKQANTRNDLTDVMKEMQGCLARKRRLELETEKVLNEKQQVNEKLDEVNGQINSLDLEINELKQIKDGRGQKLRSYETELEQLKSTIGELDKKTLFLKSQKEFIEKLHAQYQDMPDPIVEGRFYAKAAPMDHHTGIIGKVKEVNPLGEDQLQQLKQRFSQSLGYGGEQSLQLYEIVCETKFVELDPQQISLKINEINSQISEYAARRDFVSEQIEEHRELFKEIIYKIQDKEKKHSILESQKNDIQAEEQKLQGEMELVFSEIEEVKGSMAETKKNEERISYELETITQEIEWCQNDIKDKREAIASKSKEKENVIVSIAQLETEIASASDKLTSHKKNQSMFSETLDGWLEDINKIDSEATGQEDKKAVYEREIGELERRIEEVRDEKESFKNVLHDHIIQKEDIAQRINSSRANMNALEAEIDDIKQKVHEKQLKEQELSFNIRAIKDRMIQTYKIDLDAPERYMDLSSREKDASQCPLIQMEAEMFGKVLEPKVQKVEKVAQRVEEQVEEEIDINELVLEIEKLRKQCDSFGSVNLVAIEEYEQLKERFEFLTKQQSDLFEAKSQLMSTINKINRSTRQMFMETFTKVSEQFRIYFRMLFGGGEAQLVLLEPDNVLESGIEIIARPPGKKLQSISLLSGGEKTLTAIALIFGVFKVNPSPFCVLDEIDAALDESNVGRFGFLLKDFAKIAQFIVITHNKKTIANANVMYGITMPETGCSRVVSVKFSSEEKQEEVLTAGV